MIEVRYFEQYARDDGKVQSHPPSIHDDSRWYKEFRLEAEIGGQRLNAALRESCMAPFLGAPKFNSYVKDRLAGMIGRRIEDEIRGQL